MITLVWQVHLPPLNVPDMSISDLSKLAVLQEVKTLEGLNHPNIISYKHSWLERTKPADFGPDNIPTLFILTEYANAGNLHDFIFYNKDR